MRFSYLRSCEITDPGKKRPNNEDAAIRLPGSGVFCVADGMGGAADGELASRAVVDALSEAFSGRHSAGVPDFEATKLLVSEAALNANAWIREHAENRGMTGTGSTVVVLVFDERNPNRAAIMHAGDSRAYRLRGDTLTRLTNDHSLAVEAGLEHEDQLGPMFRAMVTRAVGIKPGITLDETPVDVAEGDLFILCSDGLTTMLTDEELVAVLLNADAEGVEPACNMLVDESNARGGFDNITVVAVRVGRIPVSAGDPVPEMPVDATLAPTAALDSERPAEQTHAAVDTPVTGNDDEAMPVEEESETFEEDTTPPSDGGEPAGRPACSSSDMECATPVDEYAEETTGQTIPIGELQTTITLQPNASEPSHGRLWMLAAIFALGVVVVTWLLVGRPSRRPVDASLTAQTGAATAAAVRPAKPYAGGPVSTQQKPTVAARPVPMAKSVALPTGRVQLSDKDMQTMRATLPTRIDGTLQTGEWGYMADYLQKWSLSIPDFLAKSGRETLYAGWRGLWEKARGGEPDPQVSHKQYREEVVNLCRRSGFELPPEELDVAWNVPAQVKADTYCRLIYKLQKHLCDNARDFLKRVQADTSVTGTDTVQILTDLWFFVGDGDTQTLEACVSRANEITKDQSRLDKWLAACGDSPIPLNSIRMVPSSAVPRLLQNSHQQRQAIAKQLDLVPSQVAFWRQLNVAELAQPLDGIQQLHKTIFGEDRATEANMVPTAEGLKNLKGLLEEIHNAAKIAKK